MNIQTNREVGVFVESKVGESTEELIRRFKKKYSKSGILQEYRNKMFFEKPSVKKRKKSLLAERRRQKEEEKQIRTIEKIKKKRDKEKRRNER